MLIKSIIAVAATAALAAKLLQHLNRDARLAGAGGDGNGQPDDVNRWEAEGGNLPEAPPMYAFGTSARD